MSFVRKIIKLTLAFYFYGHFAFAESITVGVQDISYFPHYDYTDDQQHSLFEWLLEEIEQDTELTFDVQSLPIKRLDHAFFNTKELDLIFPTNPNWYQNRADIAFSKPIVNIIGGTMVKAHNSKLTMHDFKVLVVPFGFKPIEWQKIQSEYLFRILEVPDASNSINMVLNGRADGADIEFNVANYLLRKMGRSGELSLGTELPVSNIGFHIAGHKKQEANEGAPITIINHWIEHNAEKLQSYKDKLNIVEHDELLDAK